MGSVLFRGLPLSVKQARTLARATGRVNVWSGAIRSGKTFASSIKWLQYVDNAPPGGQLVMVGRTRDSLARNVIAPMQDPNVFGELAHNVQYTSGAPFATIMGKRVYVMGASDSKAEKAIRGMTLAGAYVDEVTILSEEFFTQLLGRMSVPMAQCFVTTNPDNPAHWFKRNYLDKIGNGPGLRNNWKAWYFSLADNPSLTESYKRNIASEFTGLFYKRFILGQWVAAAGAVYDMWEESRYVVTDETMPTIHQYFSIGIDYGTTNPTSAILIGLGEDGRLYAVDEYRYEPDTRQARKTDLQLSADLRAWIEGPHGHDREGRDNPNAVGTPVIVDPAGASFRVQLFQDGLGTTAAANEVLYGIRLTTSLLSADKLRINQRCKGLLQEFPGYVWDQKATDQGLDQVVKTNDHSLDALRYALVTTEKRWRRHVTVAV